MVRHTNDSQLDEFVVEAHSMWFTCTMMSPQDPSRPDFKMKKAFYVRFFEDYYFVDGILNKNFPYGTYPTEDEKRQIVSQFKKDILEELKEKL